MSSDIEEKLNDESAGIRKKALRELLREGHPKLEKLLINALSDESESIRSRAAEELKAFRSDEAEKALMKALDDSWWIVRFYAVKGLAEMQSSSGIEVILEKSCRDLKSNIRKISAESLPLFDSDNPLIVRKLSELMKDKVEEVRNAAKASLDKLGTEEAANILNELEERQKKKEKKLKMYKELFSDIDGNT
ncbi:MAG: HEAT repeat domain-containing protein [Candidatus Hodarchaeales archaeon]